MKSDTCARMPDGCSGLLSTVRMTNAANRKSGVTKRYLRISSASVRASSGCFLLFPVFAPSVFRPDAFHRISPYYNHCIFLCDEIALPEIWKSDVRKWKSSMRVYSRSVLSRPYTSRMDLSCSASILVMLI